MANFGGFSEEALLEYSILTSLKDEVNFAEGDTYDFTRCVRSDGSVYGTSGKCRKGTETGSKEDDKKSSKKLTGASPAKDMGVERLGKLALRQYEQKHGGSYYGQKDAESFTRDYLKDNPKATVKQAVEDVASDLWQNE